MTTKSEGCRRCEERFAEVTDLSEPLGRDRCLQPALTVI
jgi:hypothetical protein